MGGSIQIESEEGEGTRFIIKLKLKVARGDSSVDIDSLKKTMTLISCHQPLLNFKKVIVLSDPYTVRLIKGHL